MIYLDNSATTRPFDSVVDAMAKCLRETYFNPSSLYAPAMRAGALLTAARREILSATGSKGQVVFTSGGTEADNLAILGIARALRGRTGHFLTTKVEHPAVLETMAEVERLGHRVTYVGVDAEGVVRVDELVDAVDEQTVLVSVMQVNNEVGAQMPIAEIARRVKEKNPRVLVHVDGVQGFLRVPMHMSRDGVDLYSLSGHKIHGPKGVGALVIEPNAHPLCTVFGGGQEGGLRSGTENVPGIAGLGEAVRAFSALPDPLGHMAALRRRLIAGVRSAVPDARLNGPEENAGHIVNFTFPVKGEVLLHALEGEGILCSTGSACASHKKSKSHVLSAMGRTPQEIDGALRFSLCPMNTEEEMDETAAALGRCVQLLRAFRRR
ncbi:MAG: cysteine desulfurase family protein [Candidatus Spyradocola sp.]|jgi:cysteine desulfurase